MHALHATTRDPEPRMSIRRLSGGRTRPTDLHPRLRGTPPRLRGRRAFSLVELLVVLTVIAIAVGITFPLLNVLRQGGRISAATNTVSVAVDAARLLAVTSDKFTITGLPTGQQATYDGTAVIFTPSGECRLVVNDQLAQDGAGDYYELSDQVSGTPVYMSYPNRINAYKDVPGRDYIALPPGTGIAGMRRSGSGGFASLEFLAPPFAVAFDEEGRLVSLDPVIENGAIFYDANNDGIYDFTAGSARSATYNPDAWDARLNAVPQVGAGTATDTDRRRYQLPPFERIETVQSLAVYNREAFDNAGLDWANPAQDDNLNSIPDITEFLTDPNSDNAEVLFFSRGSGVVIRN